MRARSFVLLCAGLSLGLAASVHGDSKTLERGWIGGEYKLATASRWSSSSETLRAFPRSTVSPQDSGVFVSAVTSNTPAGAAGLRSGDVVLEANGLSMTSLQKFRRMLDAQQPGQSLRLTVYREGEVFELPVVVGREIFRKNRTIALGLMLSSKVDVVPNPDFSLIALGFRRCAQRTELNSPETQFVAREGKRSLAIKGEGWEAWLGILSFAAHTRILSQENASPADAVHASRRLTE